MQKVIVGVVIAWLLVVASHISLVYSQPAAITEAGETSTIRLGRDLSLTLGLDVWPNQWVKSTSTFLGNGKNGGGANIGQVSAFGVGFIPNATLTYKRFFLSASYMVTPDYHFGTISDLQTSDGAPGNAALVESTFTASRQEGDFTIGYFPLDWLGVAIGYKGIFQDFDVKGRATFSGTPSLRNCSQSPPKRSNLMA